MEFFAHIIVWVSVPSECFNNVGKSRNDAFQGAAGFEKSEMLLFQSQFDDFRFRLLQIVVFPKVGVEDLERYVFGFGKGFDGCVALIGDIVAQTALQVHRAVGFLTLEVGRVLVNILADKAVDEVCL